jgi:HPt (histidine-containing phosphotransfer) domain-containing protein
VRFDELVRRLDGDEALAREMAGIFLEDVDRLVAAVRVAARERDAAQLRAAAHALKGAAANFGGAGVVGCARELERMGSDVTFDAVPGTVASLEREVEQLSQALRALIAT